MFNTRHRLSRGDARKFSSLPDGSVHLIITSPPYPMIGMWDGLFSGLNPGIGEALGRDAGADAFDLMHLELDKVWAEAFRVLGPGCFACVNIGDATRTIAGNFRLYPNHARIITAAGILGFQVLPAIIWRKQTNAPTKFMGSGMLPAGAYVTLEHEYVLIFRKAGRRIFSTEEEKANRRKSAIFWEERNTWYSDLWDFKGIRQAMALSGSRGRNAAFPLELAYRIVAMYSCKGDTVLDPFLGTGTTTLAAMALERNSLGIEIDEVLMEETSRSVTEAADTLNRWTEARLGRHAEFIQSISSKRELYHNQPHGFGVITNQEQHLSLNCIDSITKKDDLFEVSYKPGPRFETTRT